MNESLPRTCVIGAGSSGIATASVLTTPGEASYSSTKHGVFGYVGPQLAAVNLLPGWMRDPISRRLVPDQVCAVDRVARTG